MKPSRLDAIYAQPWALQPSTLGQLAALVGGDLSVRAALARTPAPPRTRGVLNIIPVQGVIEHRSSFLGDLLGGTSVEALRESLRAAMDDPDVRGIVLDIDSPGGGVEGIQELAAEIRAARGGKPIIAVANTLAASAGYWLGSQADQLMVTPSGQVGSVGIFAMHHDISRHLDAEGVTTTMISAGELKGEGNEFEPLSDEARASMQARVDAYYDQFVSDVAQGRGVSEDTVRADYGQGRVLAARDALAAGMVDSIDTLEGAVRLVSRRAQSKPALSTVATANETDSLAPFRDRVSMLQADAQAVAEHGAVRASLRAKEGRPAFSEPTLASLRSTRDAIGALLSDDPTDPSAHTSDPPPTQTASAPEDPPERGSSDSRSATVEYVTREEKASRVTELKASLAALAAEHPGVLPEKAQTQWDTEFEELERQEQDIAAWDARQNKLRAYSEDPKHIEAIEAPAIIKRKSDDDIYDVPALIRSARTPEERGQKLRDNALRAIEQTRFVGPGVGDQTDVRARVSQLVDYGDSEDREVARLVLNTGSPQYRAAFNRYVKTGGSERAAALAVGVDATGGFSVPVAFDPTIIGIGAHTTVNPYRAACRTVSITGTDTWQALTATAIVSAYAAEAAAATEQGPTFARPEYIVKRAHSFVTASYEMAQDRPDLAAELSVLFQESKDNLEENQFTLGVGTTVFPQGMFLDGAYTAVETIGNNVVAVADLYALEAALPIRYRANAAWFFNRSVIHTVAGFETATGHLFNSPNYAAVGPVQQNPGGNTGLRLLNYPVWEVPSASALITTSAAIVAVFCDPRSYVIVDRVGMSVKVIPDMLNGATPSFPTGEIGIYAFWRNTARVLNADAGRQLKVNAP